MCRPSRWRVTIYPGCRGRTTGFPILPGGPNRPMIAVKRPAAFPINPGDGSRCTDNERGPIRRGTSSWHVLHIPLVRFSMWPALMAAAGVCPCRARGSRISYIAHRGSSIRLGVALSMNGSQSRLLTIAARFAVPLTMLGSAGTQGTVFRRAWTEQDEARAAAPCVPAQTPAASRDWGSLRRRDAKGEQARKAA